MKGDEHLKKMHVSGSTLMRACLLTYIQACAVLKGDLSRPEAARSTARRACLCLLLLSFSVTLTQQVGALLPTPSITRKSNNVAHLLSLALLLSCRPN